MITIDNIRTATIKQLYDIIERTEYCDQGVALGDGAAKDQDLRRAAQQELARRAGFDD